MISQLSSLPFCSRRFPFRRITTLAVVLITVAGLTSCDTTTDFSPGGTPPGTPQSLSLAPLDSLVLWEHERSSVRLLGIVTTASGSVPTVTVVSSPDWAEASRADGRLYVRALGHGQGDIGMRASAAGYRDTTFSLPVRARPACPSAPSGYEDYLPVSDSTTWMFEASLESFSNPAGRWSLREGELTIAVSSGTCSRGTQSYDAIWTFSGTQQSRLCYDCPVETTDVGATEVGRNTFRIDSGGAVTDFMGWRTPVERYRSSSDPEEVEIRDLGGSDCRASGTLRRHVGPVFESRTCTYGFGDSTRRTLVRVP